MPRTAPPLRRGNARAIGGRKGRADQELGIKNDDGEAGSDRVTATTRTFEELDAQVFPGPGRGATPSEAAASDWWGGPSPGTVEAYHRMIELVAKHERAHHERRASTMENGSAKRADLGEQA